MPVDPAVRRLLDEWGETEEFDLAAARDGMAAWESPPEPAVAARFRDGEMGGVPVRVYEPDRAGAGPTIVWCHGGGYVLGTAAASDPLARFFGDRLECRVVSVDYRLAPEHRFPAAVDDVVSVVRELARRQPIVVCGDSAGGGLTAAACLATRDADLDVRAQVLLNPFLDLTLSFPSIAEFARGYGLNRASLEAFASLYVGDADPLDPRCSPVLAASLEGLPPAVIMTAEFDPLRDEAEAYARRLGEAGVAVRMRRWDGMVHGFYGMSEVTPAANESLEWATAALTEVLES
ncbi:MAG TPA: alpha/beta hydrolase [Acidimicrobiales bacterium]|nr:alpha/beta hydrolase [Acidimicrobiales bacterium]